MDFSFIIFPSIGTSFDLAFLDNMKTAPFKTFKRTIHLFKLSRTMLSFKANSTNNVMLFKSLQKLDSKRLLAKKYLIVLYGFKYSNHV